MTTRVWNGTNGSWSTASNWSPAGVPRRGDVADITGGIADADGVDLSQLTIIVDEVHGDATYGLTIDNTNFGARSTLWLTGGHNIALLTLKNANTYGIVNATSGPTGITIPSESNASNHGVWAIASQAFVTLTLDIKGTFSNLGGIETGKNGTLSLGTLHDVSNYGYFQVDPGGKMFLTPEDLTQHTLTNAGDLTVNGRVIRF